MQTNIDYKNIIYKYTLINKLKNNDINVTLFNNNDITEITKNNHCVMNIVLLNNSVQINFDTTYIDIILHNLFKPFYENRIEIMDIDIFKKILNNVFNKSLYVFYRKD